MIELLRPDWPLPPGIGIAFTTRRMHGQTGSSSPWNDANLGDHVGDNPAQVAANRAQLQQQLGVEQIQWLQQVHGTDCVALQKTGPALTADASYTREAGLACAVMTADCLPVLLCSADGEEVAAAHAGWRGLAAGVLESAVAQFRSPVQSIHAFLGPAIGPTAFEVGPEVKATFDGAPDNCFRVGDGDRWFADLAGLATWRLQQAGVVTVLAGGWCTFNEENRFFSHRRATVAGQSRGGADVNTTGRMASLIWRQGSDQ